MWRQQSTRKASVRSSNHYIHPVPAGDPIMKIFAALNGGLGNQMFQYAAARSLAQRVGAELVLDTWSG